MKRTLLFLLAVATACSTSTAPLGRCVEAKQVAYKKYISSGESMPAAWSQSDVWRIDPVRTLYFNQDCSSSLSQP